MTKANRSAPPALPVRPHAGFTLLEILVTLFILAALAGLVIGLVGGVYVQAGAQGTAASLTEIRNSIVARYYADLGEFPLTMSDLFRARPSSSGIPAIQIASSVTAPGWKGPYLMHLGAVYRTGNPLASPPEIWEGFADGYGPLISGNPPPPAVDDAWQHPIILQIPEWIWTPTASPPPAENWRHLRLVSAGPDGVVDTPRTDAAASVDLMKYPPKDPAHPSFHPNRGLCGDDIVIYLRVIDFRLEPVVP